MSLRDTYQSRKDLLASNLTQQGVTASGTEGLTTLINKVLDINTISFDGITLNSDKDIISYNGGTQPESAVLTAQLTLDGDPALVSGETVTFEVRKDSDDSLVETLTGTTNGSGVATCTYVSEGVGDLYVKAISGSLVSETYSIRDVLLYRQTLPTDESTIDVSGVNIPVNFKATFKVKQLSINQSFGGVYIGSNVNNSILFGKIGSQGECGIFVYNNGSEVVNSYQNNVYLNNQVIETVYTYNNGVQTITANNVTKTLSNSSITSRTYLVTKIINSVITDLIIEPL